MYKYVRFVLYWYRQARSKQYFLVHGTIMQQTAIVFMNI